MAFNSGELPCLARWQVLAKDSNSIPYGWNRNDALAMIGLSSLAIACLGSYPAF